MLYEHSLRTPIYLSVAFVVSMVAASSPVFGVEQWRRFAVAAKKAALEEDYFKAISGYQRAIKDSVVTGANVEVTCNLKLCLAQMYCTAGKFGECEKVLQSARKNIVDEHSVKDPTMEVRYWRRVTELALGRKQYKAASEASIKAMRILTRICPDHDRYRYLDAWEAHLVTLTYDIDCNVADSIMEFVRQNSNLLRRPSLARQRFGRVVERFCLTLPSKQINLSGKDVKYLGQFISAAQTLKAWTAFIRAHDHDGVGVYFDQVIQALRLVTDSAENAQAKLRCQSYLLAYLMQKPEGIQSYFDKCLKLLRTFKSDNHVSPEERDLKHSVYGQYLHSLYSAEEGSASREEKAELLRTFEQLSKEILRDYADKPFGAKSIETRLWLAYVFLKADRLFESEKLIEELSAFTRQPQCSSAVHFWVVDCHVRLSRQFLDKGDKIRARHHYLFAKHGLSKVEPKAKAAILQDLSTIHIDSEGKEDSTKNPKSETGK